MNKLAIITGFLGAVKNRYMVYRDDRTMPEKMEIASRVEGIDGLELCYPADFGNPTELREQLKKYDFGVSAVNFRSRRTGMWWRGSFTSEIAKERQEVVDDLKRAMDLTFSAACAHNRDVRICIEYKETDPRARCVFGSAGETASFCQLAGADNLGATLDIGHAIYTGERPAQSAALLARANRLFYVHLNDNDGRFDWDMLPGSYHLWEFVEMFYYLRKLGYNDDWYAFDVFSKEIDTVDTFNAVVTLTRKLESLTDRIDRKKMETLLEARNPSQTVPYLYSLL